MAQQLSRYWLTLLPSSLNENANSTKNILSAQALSQFQTLFPYLPFKDIHGFGFFRKYNIIIKHRVNTLKKMVRKTNYFGL